MYGEVKNYTGVEVTDHDVRVGLLHLNSSEYYNTVLKGFLFIQIDDTRLKFDKLQI